MSFTTPPYPYSGQSIVCYETSGGGGGGTNANTAAGLDVRNYGVVEDGSTDNTSALNTLFSTAPVGTQIIFPCVTGANYLVTGELHFTGQHTYVGTGISSSAACRIQSTYSGNVAFEFRDASYVTLQNLTLYTSNSGSPPKTIAAFGLSITITAAQNITCINCAVVGYASVAALYSIASEVQSWISADH